MTSFKHGFWGIELRSSWLTHLPLYILQTPPKVVIGQEKAQNAWLFHVSSSDHSNTPQASQNEAAWLRACSCSFQFPHQYSTEPHPGRVRETGPGSSTPKMMLSVYRNRVINEEPITTTTTPNSSKAWCFLKTTT